jgi:hypothetical protein
VIKAAVGLQVSATTGTILTLASQGDADASVSGALIRGVLVFDPADARAESRLAGVICHKPQN